MTTATPATPAMSSSPRAAARTAEAVVSTRRRKPLDPFRVVAFVILAVLAVAWLVPVLCGRC